MADTKALEAALLTEARLLSLSSMEAALQMCAQLPVPEKLRAAGLDAVMSFDVDCKECRELVATWLVEWLKDGPVYAAKYSKDSIGLFAPREQMPGLVKQAPLDIAEWGDWV